MNKRSVIGTPLSPSATKVMLLGSGEVREDEAWFSEVSPRPHDTGMVTMRSQRAC